MSTENTTNVEVDDFTFPDGRKRRRSPELQTWFLTDNRPSPGSPTADEGGQQESSLPQSGTTLASVLEAARSKRRKPTEESTSRRAIFRFPRLESCETQQPQWFRDAVRASTQRTQIRTPPSSPPYLDEPIHCWDPSLLERYSNKRSTKKETLVNTGYRSEVDPAVPSDAERLFAILEKRLHSDESPHQAAEKQEIEGHKKKEEHEEEEEVFYDAKEYFSDEEEFSESDSEVSFAVLERQDSTSSSECSELSFSTPLRRSQRTRKTKRASCVGCEDCARPAKRKNSDKEKNNELRL